MKLLKLTLSVITIFITFIFISAHFIAGESHSPATLILKFKPGSSILKDARSFSPKNYSDKLSSGNPIINSSLRLKNFLNEYNVISIKAVKPDATGEALPGGIERIFIVEIADAFVLEQTRTELSLNNQIEYAEYDYLGKGDGEFSGFVQDGSESTIPNDTYFALQWGLRNTGQNVGGNNGAPGGDINAINAWDITTGSPNTIIAILDSGMPLSHPEFSGRILQGYNFAYNNNNPADDYGHGSNVSSVAAAKGNNGSMVAGVNWNCRIIPVKILDSLDFGYYSWWVSGITYAVDNGAKVLNMSVGGSSFSQSLSDAATYAYSHNSVICACMMNTNNNVTYYPAGFLNHVIAVGALNNRMQRAVPFCWGGGSNYGSHITVVAPGEMIIGLVNNNPAATSYWCGTSQATPHVTGAVSLLFGVDSTLTFNQIYNALKNSARDQVGPPNEDTPGFDNYFGWGLIDVQGALNHVIGIRQISTTIPERFVLNQNYPNPFNPSTKIRFEAPGSAANENVELKIYDLTGKEVESLFSKKLKPGTYEADWDASKYTSGVYFYSLISNNFSETKKMILVK